MAAMRAALTLAAVAVCGAAGESAVTCEAGRGGSICSDTLLQNREARLQKKKALHTSEQSEEEGGQSADGGPPMMGSHWPVNPSGWESSMTMAVVVVIDGVEQQAGELAAFKGSETRGATVTPLIPPFGPRKGKAVYPIVIFGNPGDTDATISFKFKPSGGPAVDLATTQKFEFDGHLGNVIFPKKLEGSVPTPAPAPAVSPAPAPGGSAPAWSFDHTAFSDTMTITMLVTIAGAEQTAGTLGAFSGDSCRGLQDTPRVIPFGPHQGKSLFLLTMYGDNAAAYTLKFKMTDGSVKVLPAPITFTANLNLGSVIAPLFFTV